jgi:hypothetical protein
MPLTAVAIQTMKNSTNTIQLLSRRHLADRWGVSKETLKRREKAGELPFLKLGKVIRYRLADIEQIEAQAEVRL